MARLSPSSFLTHKPNLPENASAFISDRDDVNTLYRFLDLLVFSVLNFHLLKTVLHLLASCKHEHNLSS
jgi:hypothetical protein